MADRMIGDPVDTDTNERRGREWNPVPPGHPDREAFVEQMRAVGIEPASSWKFREDRKVFRRPGWRERIAWHARRAWYGTGLERRAGLWERLRARLSRGW